MAAESPAPLSEAELLRRRNRVALIAESLGFVGNIEYRHVYRQGTGGMQYGLGSAEADDLLSVYDEAFERDADPEDFSLEAMIAHERGHQILARHPRIAKLTAGIPLVSEEVLASVLGSIICHSAVDRQSLYLKAAMDLVMRGVEPKSAERQLETFRQVLEAML